MTATPKLMALSLLVLLVVGASAGLVWLLVFRGESTEEDAIRRDAEEYFSYAIEAQFEATYALLDVETQNQISPEAWQARNEEAIDLIGPLDGATVLSVDIVDVLNAFATIELEFTGQEPLPITVPLVKQEGTWKLSLSVDDTASDDWQRVEPAEQGVPDD